MAHGLVEKLLLAVGSIALNDSLDLVDLTADLASIDKIAELGIKELLSNPKGPSHVFDCDRLETFQVLSVRNEPHLSGVVLHVVFEVHVF